MTTSTNERRESAERNVGFLLHDTARLMRINYDRRMKRLGLTRSQWWVLNYLYFNEGATQTQLSDLLDIERATLGRLLDRLEEKGWLERRLDASDRRVKRVFLTGEVELLMKTMRSMALDVRTEALRGLSRDEQEYFVDTLTRMKRNLLAALDGDDGETQADGTEAAHG